MIDFTETIKGILKDETIYGNKTPKISKDALIFLNSFINKITDKILHFIQNSEDFEGILDVFLPKVSILRNQATTEYQIFYVKVVSNITLNAKIIRALNPFMLYLINVILKVTEWYGKIIIKREYILEVFEFDYELGYIYRTTENIQNLPTKTVIKKQYDFPIEKIIKSMNIDKKISENAIKLINLILNHALNKIQLFVQNEDYEQIGYGNYIGMILAVFGSYRNITEHAKSEVTKAIVRYSSNVSDHNKRDIITDTGLTISGLCYNFKFHRLEKISIVINTILDYLTSELIEVSNGNKFEITEKDILRGIRDDAELFIMYLNIK